MKVIQVSVRDDYLQGMSKVRPLLALSELIWNSFDAEAETVEVRFVRNPMGGLDDIVVSDDGRGLAYDDAQAAFGNLGGSWKRTRARSPDGRRILHGRRGKGRFSAFAVATNVIWQSVFKQEKRTYQFSISGKVESLGRFESSEPQEIGGADTGMTVTLRNFPKNFPSLQGDEAVHEVTQQFAFYLLQYPDIKLSYDGVRIDPNRVVLDSTEYPLPEIVSASGKAIQAQLRIVEWSYFTERSLYLCDKDGFALRETSTGYVRAPGFHFSAYIKSDFLRKMEENGTIDFETLDPDLNRLIESSREKVKEHFRTKASQSAAAVVEEWKRTRVYPYEDRPRDFVEEAERQVFDVVALNLNSYSADFEKSDLEAKRLTFSLLRSVVSTNLPAVQRIFESVIKLPNDKQKEFAELLDRTSLQGIISAAKIVTDRLDFLRGLSSLLFDPDYKFSVKERKHLQKLIADNAWIFGEHYHLSVDDESLDEVLRRHLELNPQSDEIEEGAAAESKKRRGIVDLMVSRVVLQPRGNQREHLIIEIKRPTVAIDDKAATQIERYANEIAEDPRFNKTDTRWVFWAVSNEVSRSVERKCRQKDRPEGILFQSPDNNLVIWVKTWGEIMQEAEGRMRFYREKLEYRATQASGMAYLQETYSKYLPSTAPKGKAGS